MASVRFKKTDDCDLLDFAWADHQTSFGTHSDPLPRPAIGTTPLPAVRPTSRSSTNSLNWTVLMRVAAPGGEGVVASGKGGPRGAPDRREGARSAPTGPMAGSKASAGNPSTARSMSDWAVKVPCLLSRTAHSGDLRPIVFQGSGHCHRLLPGFLQPLFSLRSLHSPAMLPVITVGLGCSHWLSIKMSLAF